MERNKRAYFSLWIGQPPSIYQILSFLSVLRNGHSFQLYTYRSYDIPGEIRQFSADLIVPESEFKEWSGSYGSFSDYFRYKALSDIEAGNVWIDADQILLKPYLPPDEFIFGQESENIFNVSVLALPKTFPEYENLINESKAQSRGAWGETGPKLFSKSILRNNLESKSLPVECFYPIHFHEIELLFSPSKTTVVEKLVETSIGVHLWFYILRSTHFPVSKMPPTGSFLSTLFEEFYPECSSKRVSRIEFMSWICLIKLRKLFRSYKRYLRHIFGN